MVYHFDGVSIYNITLGMVCTTLGLCVSKELFYHSLSWLGVPLVGFVFGGF